MKKILQIIIIIGLISVNSECAYQSDLFKKSSIEQSITEKQKITPIQKLNLFFARLKRWHIPSNFEYVLFEKPFGQEFIFYQRKKKPILPKGIYKLEKGFFKIYKIQ